MMPVELSDQFSHFNAVYKNGKDEITVTVRDISRMSEPGEVH